LRICLLRFRNGLEMLCDWLCPGRHHSIVRWRIPSCSDEEGEINAFVGSASGTIAADVYPSPEVATPDSVRLVQGLPTFWNCELLLVYRLMGRATSLIVCVLHTSEMKFLLNLPSIILVLVKTLIILLLFLEQARGRPTCSLRATWCPWAPRYTISR